MKKLTLVFVSIFFLFLASCPIEENTNYTVGLVLPEGDRWNKDLIKFQSIADTLYFTLVVTQSDDLNAQDTAIQSLITNKVDAIIVTATDTSAEIARSWVANSNIQDIPLVCYDRLIENVEGIEWYLSFDNYEVGVLQGQYILDNTETGDTILFFTGPDTDSNAEVFESGALSVLEAAFTSNDRFLFNNQTYAITGWDPSNANSIFDQLVTDPESDSINSISAILSPNDWVFLGGDENIYSGMLDASYTDEDIAPLTIVGQDATIAAIQAILANPRILDMTIMKDSRKLVPYIMSAVNSIINGETPLSNNDVNNGSEDVPSYLLAPVVVDSINCQVEIIDSGFYTEEDLGL